MEHVSLLQPRHNYAPETGQGHIYSNTSLWTAGARIMEAGGAIAQLHDENLRPFTPTSERVGINLLGPPYISVARRIMRDISAVQSGTRFLLGGQIVDLLSEEEFRALFGKDAVNGNNDALLAEELGIDVRALPQPEETSLIPAYEKIPDGDMLEYLSREISFYVSQGCRFNCAMCIAEKGKPERYRKSEVIERDLTYLISRARMLGLRKLSFYLSNLDVFQKPIGTTQRESLTQFAELFKRIIEANPDITLTMRGLSTVSSFCSCHDDHPEAIRAMVRANFATVGFGVDGWGKEDWKAIRKSHNTEENVFRSVALAAEEYGLTPEILMVFGHSHKYATPEAIREIVRIMGYMHQRYGAIPRPHVVKNILPGTDAWAAPENQGIRDRMVYEHPDEDWQPTDFCCGISSISHPHPGHRCIAPAVEDAYKEMIAMSKKSTDYIYSEASDLPPNVREENHRKNIGRYDR